MAANPYLNNPYQNTAGLAQIVGTTGTTTATFPVTTNILQYPVNAAYDPFPFPNPYAMNFIGHFRLRKVENGYVIEYIMKEGETPREYFAEDLKDAGERITALCVGKALAGEKR